MHPLMSMSARSHLWLRLAAVALLATAGLWPRGEHANAHATTARATLGTNTAQTTAARLVSPPRMGKVVVVDADESHLTN